MNCVAHSAGNRVAVAIVFLCLLTLTLCQVLGPTARLNHSFGTGDLSESALIAASEHIMGAHSPLPSRCAAIKLAPVEIRTGDLAPNGVTCKLATPSTSTPPKSAGLSVPTPPPRRA
jgi:hypothetical protein